ncbi:UpxY family transcription antiterminator [Mariniflexile litorale]|uniref:UpxY family transcription antiterminator n=1 Tax=Mariniflexile litorale TaxID=3045158 RepID=A0AAU7EH22_9FLAO|nr:UpxY family transcription antiterminator [Mariniflexile sp. KMM 9835]MDQ8209933.1 UpxY family transcription antiterminator [Mariniflexile sp. KMM 9835]
MNWYVLYVKSKQEFKVQDYLNKLDLELEAFCPYRIELKQWSDRKKKIAVPLISSIVLIKTKEINRDKVFSVPGTIRYLFWLGKPAIVKEFEVEQLLSISHNENIISHEVEEIKLGKHIDLTRFGFSNRTGVIQRVSNNVFWVVLESLGYTLKLTLKKQ